MKFTNAVVLLVLLCSSSFLAAEERTDYKCFVTASQGMKIVFFGWFPSGFDRNTVSLVGKRLPDEKGNPNFIKKVHECVLLNNEFSDAVANKLDKKTLR